MDEKMKETLDSFLLTAPQYKILNTIKDKQWVTVSDKQMKRYEKEINDLDEEDLLDLNNLFDKNSIRITDAGKELLEKIKFDVDKTVKESIIKSYLEI